MMKTRTVGVLALVTLVLTAVWLIFLIWDQATAGPLDTIDQVMAYLANRDWRFTLTYLNASLFTISATMLMTSLYPICKQQMPIWSLIGFVFIPVYCVLNLVAYLSQITLIPGLLNWAEATGDVANVQLLLAQTFQLWPTSIIGFLNGLAYAILGIPSIVFGLVLRGGRVTAVAGWLLLLNGISCIFGIVGYMINSPLLSMGILIGGVLFLLAMIPLSIAFLRTDQVFMLQTVA